MVQIPSTCIGCAGDEVAVEEVEAAQEDGVVLPSRIKQTKEQRRKARAKGEGVLPSETLVLIESIHIASLPSRIKQTEEQRRKAGAQLGVAHAERSWAANLTLMHREAVVCKCT